MDAGFVPMFSPYAFDPDDVSHHVNIKTEEEKQKDVAQSIDVTKALMLMGFGSWKNLEPGRKMYLKLSFDIFCQLNKL